jgi:hypothetical protein
MKRLGAILLGAATLAAAGSVLLSSGRLSRARGLDRGALSSLAHVAHDAGRVLALRASRQTVAEQKRPEQDVIARVNAVLSEAGLGERHFGGLRPESDSAVPGSACRRQTLRITLRQLGLPELERSWSDGPRPRSSGRRRGLNSHARRPKRIRAATTYPS